MAGAIAATVWGLQEPLDRRLFRCDYSDVSLVGGLHVHALNGALFGLAFDAVRRRTRVDQQRLAIGLAVAEHTVLWPLLGLFEPEVVKRPRAFAQGVYRHALFGYVLGRLA
ncbi:MAG TPA: hypothetical protein VFK71_01750 [Gaiellaceae bacterium]|nr:hypothetical protein [Gaiellaceae bacterium]HET7807189.1 hypothetical protein [Gaiellaceae bacterium]